MFNFIPPAEDISGIPWKGVLWDQATAAQISHFRQKKGQLKLTERRLCKQCGVPGMTAEARET